MLPGRGWVSRHHVVWRESCGPHRGSRRGCGGEEKENKGDDKAAALVMVVPLAEVWKAGRKLRRCQRSSWVYASGPGDTSVGALSPETGREAVTVGTCMWRWGRPGPGPQELKHLEVSERRSNLQTHQPGRGKVTSCLGSIRPALPRVPTCALRTPRHQGPVTG